jgi:serine/threonine protein kinase
VTTLLDTAGGRVVTVAVFYKAYELLGKGRFAEVYKAHHQQSNTDVALKMYLQADEAAHRLAAGECATLQQLGELNTEYYPRLRQSLKHRVRNRPHPVIIMELGQYTGPDGQFRTLSLKELLASLASEASPHAELWAPEQLRAWIAGMALAVKLMHDHGVIHRDIKPANILIKRRAGGTQAMPFLLDFNSSVRDSPDLSQSGTKLYLPPEVTTGKRRAPSPADDLWAAAMTLWEVLHGPGSPVSDQAQPHRSCPADVRAALAPILRRALNLQPAERYASAADLLEAVEGALAGPRATKVDESGLSTDEWVVARKEMERTRDLIVDELAGDEELPIPKDIQEQVAILFSWLAAEDTQSFDLVGDLVRLGPRAIPAVLQEAHRLNSSSEVFDEVVTALASMAQKAPDMANRSLAFYSTSSNLGVRRMCRALCRALERLPTILLDCLVTDEGVLMPDERLELAELCIQYCDDPTTAILSLTKYMCREYVIDLNRYRELRDKVALPLGNSKFEQKALLVVEDTAGRIWEELVEFERVPADKREKIERGLLQLMSDAFGAMGGEALDLLKANRVPRVLEGQILLRPWRVFARKLGNQYAPARSWLESESRQHPADQDVNYALGKDPVPGEAPGEGEDALSEVLQRYLALGERRDLDDLRFKKDARLFELLRRGLQQGHSIEERRRVVRLLHGFESRMRGSVVRTLLDHWTGLSEADHETALEALTENRIEDNALRHRAVNQLEAGLGGAHDLKIRRALNRLLED